MAHINEGGGYKLDLLMPSRVAIHHQLCHPSERAVQFLRKKARKILLHGILKWERCEGSVGPCTVGCHFWRAKVICRYA